jgi:hypothetical protein
MHGLVATSMCHLRYLQPNNNHASLRSEAYHWQQAITLFQKQLSSPKPEKMDAVISTCMILTILAFTADNKPSASWIFSPQASSSWLFVQGGMYALKTHYPVQLSESIWNPVFMDADDFNGSALIQEPGLGSIPKAFADLCDIDSSSTGRTNPYHEALRILTELMKLEYVSANFAKFVYFMTAIKGKYVSLIYAKDPRALLIMGYWFGILCKIDQWWVRDRANLECRSICLFLEDSDDPRIVKLLEFPAEACGYTWSTKDSLEQSANESTDNVEFSVLLQGGFVTADCDTL